MNLSALPDDQSRVGYSWTPPLTGERAMATQIFDLNNEPDKLLRNLDFDALRDLSDVLAEMNDDSADIVLAWLDTDASIKKDVRFVQEIHAGAYGDSARSVVKQAIETIAKHRAERVVQGYYPNWSAE